jgi:hypothetical protein
MGSCRSRSHALRWPWSGLSGRELWSFVLWGCVNVLRSSRSSARHWQSHSRRLPAGRRTPHPSLLRASQWCTRRLDRWPDPSARSDPQHHPLMLAPVRAAPRRRRLVTRTTTRVTRAATPVTDRRGHRARWTAALIIAPGAAAVFGATTSWAMQVTPPGSAMVKAPARSAASTRLVPARDLMAPRRTVAARQRQLVVKRARLKNLQRKLTALAKPLEPPAAPAGRTTGPVWAASSGGSGGNAQAPARRAYAASAHYVRRTYAPPAAASHAAAPQAAAPPVAPPPVHASTGAS